MAFRESSLARPTAAVLLPVLVLSFWLISCGNSGESPAASAAEHPGGAVITAPEAGRIEQARTQAVYVPVYSHVYHADGIAFDLAATLSIRNTDRDNPIAVSSVGYYDMAGKLVREYAPSPVVLQPLGTLEFVVGEDDRSGGSGAKFIVNWSAQTATTQPVIECVMIGTKGQQGISFLSVGRPLE